MDEIKIAQTDSEIMVCWEAIKELRPHLVKEKFVETVRRMEHEGFKLAFISHEQKAVCVAGFRICEMFYRGKSVYVDDLVTLPSSRSQKFGSRMLDWIIEFARNHECGQVHLDSGVQRFDAHRFYLNHGFHISSHHFQRVL